MRFERVLLAVNDQPIAAMLSLTAESSVDPGADQRSFHWRGLVGLQFGLALR